MILTTDKMIRPHLKEYLQVMYSRHLLYEEIAIDKGNTVVDLALFSPDELIGFEIKSGKDSFTRLPRQVRSYDKFFSKNYIVMDDKHLKKVEKYLPKHWGVILAYHDGLNVVIELYKDASDNPHQNKSCVLDLLWKDESVNLLKKYDLYKGMSKSLAHERVSRLNTNLSMHQTLNEVCNALKARSGWKSYQSLENKLEKDSYVNS